MSNKRPTVKSLLEMIDARISHIEDITADNRDIIIKLVKQNNQIVQFLSQIEVEDITNDFEDILEPKLSKREREILNKVKNIKNLVDEFMERRKDLEEFEEELQKHKDDITPGQVGES